MRRLRWTLGLGLICALCAGLAVTDHVLGRADRVEAAKRLVELDGVRDQILRFELEQGVLPRSLADLVPGYLRLDQLEYGGRPLFRYDSEQRLVRQAEGSPIRGLFRRRMTPASASLPTIEEGGDRAEPMRATGPDSAEMALQVPVGPEFPDPPEGALVFEAEHFTDTNYGWEIREDPECSGGAYVHCKEGMGNCDGQAEYGVGDFYNIHSTTDLTYLRYHFHLPERGRYYVYGRMWTTGTRCSNFLRVAVDRGGPGVGGMGNKAPFRWHLSSMYGGPVRLAAGDHFLHVFMHEDGVRLDQFLITPVGIPKWRRGGQAYRTNVKPGTDTAFIAGEGPSVQLSFDLKSMVITPQTPPECRVVFRRLRRAEGGATLRVELQNGALDGGDLRLLDAEVDLTELPEVASIPIDFGRVALARLPRREYLLIAELVAGEKKLASTHQPLMRPFSWEVSPRSDFLENEEPGTLDGGRSGGGTDKTSWEPLAITSWDHFGVIDFGLHTNGNSLHAPQFTTVYARTRIRVPREDDYLLKVQADDQMLLWLDGKEIYRHDHKRPVTRASYREKVHLTAGDHRLRIRVNQEEGRWQASVRIRTSDDALSDVVGLPMPE